MLRPTVGRSSRLRIGEWPLMPVRNQRALALVPIAPRVHEPHDWIAAEELRVPTHRLEDCVTCRVWVDHARDCVDHCRPAFENARREACLDLQQNAAAASKRRLHVASRISAEVYADKVVEANRARVEHERLTRELLHTQLELRHARLEVESLHDQLHAIVAEQEYPPRPPTAPPQPPHPLQIRAPSVIDLCDLLSASSDDNSADEELLPVAKRPGVIPSAATRTPDVATPPPRRDTDRVLHPTRGRDTGKVDTAKGKGRKKNRDRAIAKVRGLLIERCRAAAALPPLGLNPKRRSITSLSL